MDLFCSGNTRKKQIVSSLLFSVKSAAGGRNPPLVDEMLRDEIPLRGEMGGGFGFI